MSSDPDGSFTGDAAGSRPFVPIERETSWRQCALPSAAAARQCATLHVGHWRDKSEHEREWSAPVALSHYTIEVLLRDSVIDCYRDGRLIKSGSSSFGGTQIAAPGQKMRCVVRRPIEAIHIFAPVSVVSSTYEDLYAHSCDAPYTLIDPGFSADPIMGELASALVEANNMRCPYAGLYCKCLALSVLVRAMEAGSGDPSSFNSRTGLVPWRLRRAIDFIDDNLGEPLTLRDIAEHAGLSRMHFAAQFKQATGLSPHAFLLHRRLATAKKMLIDGRFRIVDIALSVGFYSQAHFTTVFRKALGTTPGRWREQAAAEMRRASESRLDGPKAAPVD